MGNVASKIVDAVADAVTDVGKACADIVKDAAVTTAVVVGTAALVVGAPNVVIAACAVYCAYQFYTRADRTLMSAEDANYKYIPISTVLANCNRLDLLDSMATAVTTKNRAAIERVGDQLDTLALDGIKNAFIHGVNVGMVCEKNSCGKTFTNIDDMCYCPEAATKCHHNNTCCQSKHSRGMITV